MSGPNGTMPDHAPEGGGQPPPAAAAVGGSTHPSAMQLFAADPNADPETVSYYGEISMVRFVVLRG